MRSIKLFLLLQFTVTATIAQVQPPTDITGSSDLNMNWTRLRVYSRISGAGVATDNKSFFDNSGRSLQTQTKTKYKLSNGTVVTHVFASQPVYDAFGRPAAQSLAAPIDAGEFRYKSDFIKTTGGTVYDYRNFDRYKPTPTGNEQDKTKTPDAVGNQPGTLGWYYSNANSWEPYTPTTSYPYSRQSFYRDGTGAAKESALAGDVFRMGQGRESASYSTGIQNELTHYLQVRNQYFTAAEMGNLPANLVNNAVQMISQDANDREAVIISDKDGKQLVAARPGTSGTGNLTINNTVTVGGNWTRYRFIIDGISAFPFLQTNSYIDYSVPSGGTIKVSVSNDRINFSQPVSLPANAVGGTNQAAAYYLLESNEPFTVTWGRKNYYGAMTTDDVDAFCRSCSAKPVTQANGDVLLFKLLSPGTVTITGGAYQLYNMSDNEQLVSFTSGNTLPAGYYKVVAGTDAVTVTYSNTYTDLSYHFYNQLGQKVATIAPEGVKLLIQNGFTPYPSKANVPFISLFEYNERGQLISGKDADVVSKSELVYRKDGKLRFSQSAEQRKTGRYSYTNYDAWGRIIESGEYHPSSYGIAFNADMTVNSPMKQILENTDQAGGLTTAEKTDVVITKYDVADNSHGLSGYTQNDYFLRNAVSYTEKLAYVANSNYAAAFRTSRTWYNYDEEGNVLWMIQHIDGLGFKTVDYTYDLDNKLTKVVYQKNTASETFAHYYTYDEERRLSTVSTNTTDDINTATQQAAYQYYLHGALKRTILNNNLQGIDYTYTLGGQLKAINNAQNTPTTDPGQDGVSNGVFADAFGMTLDYFTGDYLNTRSGIVPIKTLNVPSATAPDLFTGQIKAMTWFSRKPNSVPGLNDPTSYVFTYDEKYQFTESIWGTNLAFNNGTSNPASYNATLFNKERVMQPGNSNPGYDRNGNILYLQRNNPVGQEMDKFQYNYIANTNKLQSITETAATGPTGTYATYTYDDDGQLIQETPGPGADAGAKDRSIAYDVTGKVKEVYTFNETTYQWDVVCSYIYNERGQRIRKILFDPSGELRSSTFYVLDAAGNEMAVYETNHSNNTTVLQEHAIYGSGREGIYYRPSNVTAYELTDHLGNVRAVVARNNGTLETRMYTDYYPFGFAIRRAGTNDYRYGYQGEFAEEDKETGWNAFELRMYDSRIGRWLSVDPEGEFWSPYNAMGNDPANKTDPTGGKTNIIKVRDSQGRDLFSLDDGKKEVTYMTAKELYDKGIQWFEPLADNYMPIIPGSINPFITAMNTLKHFTWDEIAEFADVDRLMFTYAQGFSGDWKSAKAKGFFLVTVDGFPYYADAVGQIPFAADYYRRILKGSGNIDQSVMATIAQGRKFGEGKLIGGKPENGNGYDIYFILRGAMYAAHKYIVSGQNTTIQSRTESIKTEYILKKTDYSPSNLGGRIWWKDAQKYKLR